WVTLEPGDRLADRTTRECRADLDEVLRNDQLWRLRDASGRAHLCERAIDLAAHQHRVGQLAVELLRALECGASLLEPPEREQTATAAIVRDGGFRREHQDAICERQRGGRVAALE